MPTSATERILSTSRSRMDKIAAVGPRSPRRPPDHRCRRQPGSARARSICISMRTNASSARSCGRTYPARCRKRSRSRTSSSATTIRKRSRRAPIRALETGFRNGTSFFRLFCRRGHDRRLARRPRLAAGARENTGFLRHSSRRLPAGGNRPRSRHRRVACRGAAGGLRFVGGLPWYEYTDQDARAHIDICFEHRQAARSRHPHAGR